MLRNQQVKTDRIIPSNKLGTIIRDGEKGTCMLIYDYVALLRYRAVSRKTPKYFKTQRPYGRNTAHVECKDEGDTTNNRGNWNRLIFTQKIPEQHTGKARK
jgi:hypothetical protein